jgi:hypothetical protein
MAAVFSLKYEKMGEPIIRNKYLNKEKYNISEINQTTIVPKVSKKLTDPSLIFSLHDFKPAFSINHSINSADVLLK